ncbi:Histone-lysine N-methyltransferase ATX2 [Picochlorum sp. SENEW3]|nr:Histone-lysine N-methyltransferase ATX2 [Picochlorum sp. SENEW3]
MKGSGVVKKAVGRSRKKGGVNGVVDGAKQPIMADRVMKERLAAQGNGESKEKMNDEKGASVQEEKGHDEAVEVKKDSKSSTPVSATGTNNSEGSGKNNADDGIIVAGKEVVGRKIALWSKERMDWPKAEIVRFKPSFKQHLVRYLDREEGSVKHKESWVDLSKSRFQWLGPVPEVCPPNPSYRKAPKRKAAIGYKVKVFWPGMAKWYVGKVLDYDTDSKKHTVKYKDGDVQQISLRHEAVLYLGKDEEGKDPSGAVGKKSASAKKEVTSGRQDGNNVAQKKRGRPFKTLKESTKAEQRNEQQAPKKSKQVDSSKQLKEYQRIHSLNREIVGARVAIFWSGEGTYFKGKIEKYNPNEDTHLIFYDDGEVEWVNLATSEFRYLTPRTRSTGCSKEFLKAMENLRAEQYKTSEEIENYSGMKGSVKPVETISRRAPVKEACVSWRLSIRGADKKWYLGEVISYQRESDLHLVLYDDGEHERLHLPSELIAWHCLAKDRKTPVFPGKHKSVDVPVGTKAIGWRIAVYWPIEDEFFHGEIVAFDPEEETYEVNYDDGDETIITLADDKVKWLFPPGVKYDRKAILERMETKMYDESDNDSDEKFIVNNISRTQATKRGGKRGRPNTSSIRRKSSGTKDFMNKRSMPMHDSGRRDVRFIVSEKQDFPVEPTFVRNITSTPSFPGLEKKTDESPYQCAISVKIYLSDSCRMGSDKGNNLDERCGTLNDINKMMRRVQRAEESLMKGIPTYLPSKLIEPNKQMNLTGNKRNSIGSPRSKMIVRRKVGAFQPILVDDDSESDNLNNSRGNFTPKYSRFRRSNPYMPLTASIPKLPPESSSGSSSDEDGLSDLEKQQVYRPFIQPGGKVKPQAHEACIFPDSESIVPPKSPEEPRMVAPDHALEPIESPFGGPPVAPQLFGDEADLGLSPNPLEPSESMGNLLGMSRNSSGALLLTQPLQNDFRL